MTYHFYNSFNLGAGYSHADYIDGRPTVPQRKLPHELDIDYKNGGCIMVLRTCGDMAYLLVKKILYTNHQKTHVQQGRTVNINFSIEGSFSELSKLCMITLGILSEWKNFCRRLGDLIVIPAVDGNEYNYSIDSIDLDKLMLWMEKVGMNTHLPQLEASLRHPQKNDAILLVPMKSERYYVSNASSLDLTNNTFHKQPVHWLCVIPASRNEKDPDTFEKLTQFPRTSNYIKFLQDIEDAFAVATPKKLPPLPEADNTPPAINDTPTIANRQNSSEGVVTSDDIATYNMVNSHPLISLLNRPTVKTVTIAAIGGAIGFTVGLAIARLFYS